ncbi:hypothetical protein TSAR_011027 [Trichomalopsis sarcophagae]|uniref:Uncharacterized protein n=1 Tax=Trichomalopsis sarcophagae TaxID=543379 RepID=A0A232FKM6_9HYME|nr:hypothetical protein TSAR_011027 [Trichomalopsis sarcophagae]
MHDMILASGTKLTKKRSKMTHLPLANARDLEVCVPVQLLRFLLFLLAVLPRLCSTGFDD